MPFSVQNSVFTKPGPRLVQAATNFALTTSATRLSENVTVLSTSPAAQQPSAFMSPTSWWRSTGFPSFSAFLNASSTEASHFTPWLYLDHAGSLRGLGACCAAAAADIPAASA